VQGSQALDNQYQNDPTELVQINSTVTLLSHKAFEMFEYAHL